MKNKSFTLIELLVVIVIIGILAGVIIVSTSSSISKANIAKVKVFENSIQNELGANMVSRWKLDEIISTTTTPDAWGSNTGTLGDGATTSTYPTLKSESECVTGKCMYFDGVDSYIEVAPSTTLNQNYTGLTVSAWINFTEIQPGSDGVGYIIHKNTSQGALAPSFILRVYNGNRIRFHIYDGTNILYILSPSGYNDGIWHHIIGTYNGSEIILYIDGAVIGSTAATSFANNDGYLSIGGTRYSPTYRPFNGLIDDARAYNAALSSSQIKQEYIVGLNSLLANNNISEEEYNQRLETLAGIE